MMRILPVLKMKLVWCLMILTAFTSKAQDGVEVIGYVTSYNLSSSYQKINFCQVTTLNVSFINPDAQGNLSFPLDLTDEILYAKAQNPKMKVFAALAGGTESRNPTINGYYRNLLSNANRAGFIQKLVDYVIDNDLDGIDVDLEGEGIFNGYNEFSIELCAALAAVGKETSVALPWFLPRLVSQQALEAYDYINIMAYDDGGNWKPDPKQHSSMEHMDKCIDFWTNTKGIAREKLAVGVPFYGYTWNTSPAGAYTYREIADRGFADVDNDRLAFHNGRPTMRNKVAKIYNQGFKGVMIWQLGQDHWGEFSMLDAIDKKIKDLTSYTVNGCDDDGNNTYIPEEDPIAFFPFETDILDYSTNGKDFDNGTNNGAVIVNDGLRGNVMSFSGNEMVTIQSGTETPDGLPSRNEMTVSTWVKTNSAHEWGGFVGAFQDNGAEESGWVLGTRNQRFSMGLTGADGTISYLSDDADFELNEWYHVMATYDGSDIRLYVNGVEKASMAESGKIFYLNSGWFQIGSYKDNDEDNGHDGLLDNVTIWERALSSDEVTDAYNGEIISSISSINPNARVNVYPNPASEVINIKANVLVQEWSLYNCLGAQIKNGQTTSISIDGVASGVYFLKIRLEEGDLIKKVTIK